MLLVFLSRLR